METQNKEENVKLKPGFNQVCIWPGTIVGSDEIEEFEGFMQDVFGIKIQYLETIVTGPNRCEHGYPIMGTGGRKDVFFAVRDDDVMRFATTRLAYGIRWVEDVLSDTNGYHKNPIYPNRVLNYRTW